MTEKAISPLRQRLVEDMTIRRLGPKTQHDYIRHVKSFADFLGRSPDKATAEDIHRYQLRLASIGTTVPTVNANASALRFFFKVTLKHSDLGEEVVSAREPRRLPIVLSPEEVGRLLTSATNIKHKARLSRTRYYPIYLGSLAQGLGAAGHLTEAYLAIDTALEWINKHEEYWCAAEFLRIKGELFRLEGSAVAAEDHHRQALEWARRQNALSWELRAATSLAQLWRQNGRIEEADKLLSSVYSRCSEGFETADLMTARALSETFRNTLSGEAKPLLRKRRLSP
jgi:hypothetical protein